MRKVIQQTFFAHRQNKLLSTHQHRTLHSYPHTFLDYSEKFSNDDPLEMGVFTYLDLLPGAVENTVVNTLENDRKYGESLDNYKERSWKEFSASLDKDTLYYYRDKSIIKNNLLYFGHGLTFITDENKKVIPGTVSSYRRDYKYPMDRMVKFNFGAITDPARYRQLYPGIYLTLEQDFYHYLFAFAIEDAPPTGRRSLASIPLKYLSLSIDFLVKGHAAREAAEKRARSLYRPFNGKEYHIDDYQELTMDEKIDFTLDNPHSHTAQEAFFRGLGMMHLGEQYYPDAIFSFEKCLGMDPSAPFSFLCHFQISNIYAHWGHLGFFEKKKPEIISSYLGSLNNGQHSTVKECIELADRYSPFSWESDASVRPYGSR